MDEREKRGLDTMEKNDIEFVDIIRVLYRRRKIIVWMTLLFIVAPIIGIYALPKKQRVTELIQIGGIADGEDFRLIEKAEDAMMRFRNIVDIRTMEIIRTKGSGLDCLNEKDFRIKHDGNILRVTVDTFNPNQVIEFVNRISADFREEHDRMLEQMAQSLRLLLGKNRKDLLLGIQKITELKANIESKKRNGEIQRLDYAADILRNRNQIAGMHNDNEQNRKKLNSLENTKKEVAEQLAILEKENAGKSRVVDPIGRPEHDKTLGIIIDSAGIQTNHKLSSDLRIMLSKDIPFEISRIESAVNQLDMVIINTMKNVEILKKKLEQIEPQLKEEIDILNAWIAVLEFEQKNQKESIADLEDSIQNRRQTKMHTPKSLQTIFIIGWKMIPLFFTAGLFFSIVIAFLVEFWRNNRNSIIADKKVNK